MQEPEPKLIRRAQAGDMAAFEELVRGCQGDVWRLVCSIVRDRDMADDITQDTFVRAFRFIGGFAFRSKFSTWLFTIARRCSMDALGKRSHLADAEPPEIPVADSSERLEITAAIDALPDNWRQPFMLVEVLGLSYLEAAEVLDVRPGTIKSRMHRARAALMSALSVEGSGAGIGGGAADDV